MPTIKTVKSRVPGILVSGGDGKDIPAGTQVEVKRGFFYNGEGWVRLTDGREFPDVFLFAELDA